MLSSFIAGLLTLAKDHEEILYLTADSGEGGLDQMFRTSFPRRSFNFGIAEENMVAAASGMALSGKIPFVYTAAPFLAYRAYEFIRNDVCLQNVPVKLFGSGSGLSVSALGPTHHATEDLAVLRALPNLTILSPATPKQAYESVFRAYEIPGPVYVRLGMAKEKEFFGEDYHLSAGGFEILKEGGPFGAVMTGSILGEVLEAAEMLSAEGIDVSVADVFSLKPFDAERFLRFAAGKKHLFSVEEQNVAGGLGTLLQETLSGAGISIPLTKIGLEDRFAEGYGDPETVRRANGLDAGALAKTIRKEIR